MGFMLDPICLMWMIVHANVFIFEDQFKRLQIFIVAAVLCCYIFWTRNWVIISWCSLLYLAETVCSLLPVASYKTLSFHPKSSSSRAYATNKQHSSSSRKSLLGRAVSEDNFCSNTSSDRESSRREELIALFKRIQTEISQDESGSGNYSDTSQASTDDDSSVDTSVLKFLQQSNRGTKGELVAIPISFYH